jgi:hypothetical protein
MEDPNIFTAVLGELRLFIDKKMILSEKKKFRQSAINL